MRRPQLARTKLAAPGEQHVGIDPVLPRKHGHRNTGCARRRQSALEFSRAVRQPRSYRRRLPNDLFRQKYIRRFTSLIGDSLTLPNFIPMFLF